MSFIHEISHFRGTQEHVGCKKISDFLNYFTIFYEFTVHPGGCALNEMRRDSQCSHNLLINVQKKDVLAPPALHSPRPHPLLHPLSLHAQGALVPIKPTQPNPTQPGRRSPSIQSPHGNPRQPHLAPSLGSSHERPHRRGGGHNVRVRRSDCSRSGCLLSRGVAPAIVEVLRCAREEPQWQHVLHVSAEPGRRCALHPAHRPHPYASIGGLRHHAEGNF